MPRWSLEKKAEHPSVRCIMRNRIFYDRVSPPEEVEISLLHALIPRQQPDRQTRGAVEQEWWGRKLDQTVKVPGPMSVRQVVSSA